jgi:hypothetical protein
MDVDMCGVEQHLAVRPSVRAEQRVQHGVYRKLNRQPQRTYCCCLCHEVCQLHGGIEQVIPLACVK